MAYFRKPKTQGERREDHALGTDTDARSVEVKARLRGKKKVGAAPPSDWDDIKPAARKDRSRGKASHSPARKAKQKEKRPGGPD